MSSTREKSVIRVQVAIHRSKGPSRRLRDIFPDDLFDRILDLCNAHHPPEGPQQPNGEQGLGGATPRGTSDVTLDSAWSPTSKGIDAMGPAAGTPGGGVSYTQLLWEDDEDGQCLIEELVTPENLS